MYESFFNLSKKPFQITTDPSFLWMGKKHREALSTLKYGVMDNKGFLLLTGDVGTGKTTLINRLVNDIQDKGYTAKIPDPGLSKYDFYRMVSRYFGLPIEVRTKSDFLEPFSRFLNDAHQERKSVLLIIDEAQRLKHDLMEEIRLLSNLERQDSKLLNIFFVGQNEFNSILLQPENRALMRRITITYNIDPLDRDETCDYIRHRLKVAGSGYEIFSSAAMDEVYDFSSGFPRQINIICDLAMFFASQLAQRTINRRIVSQCRDRISFSIEAPPEETRTNIRASAPATPYRPITRSRWPWLSLQRVVLLLLLLALIGGGIYLAPDAWISSGVRWAVDLRQRVWPLAGDPEQEPEPIDPVASDTAENAAAVPTGVTPEAYGKPAEFLPLLTPRRPPPMDPAGVKAPPVHPPPVNEQVPPLRPPETIQPDPGDAIDWLLEKRRQGAAPSSGN